MTTLEERLSNRRTTDVRKESLFVAVNADGTGNITETQFSELYDEVVKEAKLEGVALAAAQLKVHVANRKNKRLCTFIFILLAVLALVLGSNFALSMVANTLSKELSSDSGTGVLTDATTKKAILTGAFHMKGKIDKTFDSEEEVLKIPGAVKSKVAPGQDQVRDQLFNMTLMDQFAHPENVSFGDGKQVHDEMAPEDAWIEFVGQIEGHGEHHERRLAADEVEAAPFHRVINIDLEVCTLALKSFELTGQADGTLEYEEEEDMSAFIKFTILEKNHGYYKVGTEKGDFFLKQNGTQCAVFRLAEEEGPIFPTLPASPAPDVMNTEHGRRTNNPAHVNHASDCVYQNAGKKLAYAYHDADYSPTWFKPSMSSRYWDPGSVHGAAKTWPMPHGTPPISTIESAAYSDCYTKCVSSYGTYGMCNGYGHSRATYNYWYPFMTFRYHNGWKFNYQLRTSLPVQWLTKGYHVNSNSLQCYCKNVRRRRRWGSVICTELSRQNLLSQNTLDADTAFGAQLKSTTHGKLVFKGYHFWAKPLVSIMRRSEPFTSLVSYFALSWAKHMSFMMGASDDDSLFGRVLMYIGAPYCFAVGCMAQVVSCLPSFAVGFMSQILTCIAVMIPVTFLGTLRIILHVLLVPTCLNLTCFCLAAVSFKHGLKTLLIKS